MKGRPLASLPVTRSPQASGEAVARLSQRTA